MRQAIHNSTCINYDLPHCLLSTIANMAIGLLIIGCEESRFSQCEPIFQIAHQVTTISKNLSYPGDRQLAETKSGLEIASIMNQAADKFEALRIDNSKLIQYRNKLATVYRIYSRATYDAVKARENKNLKALESAHNDAVKAGKIQRNLIRQINAYCFTKE